MRWLRIFPLAAALIAAALAGCSSETSFGSIDRSGYTGYVLEDVTAILEGMARAHGAERVVVRGPDYSSSRPHTDE